MMMMINFYTVEFITHAAFDKPDNDFQVRVASSSYLVIGFNWPNARNYQKTKRDRVSMEVFSNLCLRVPTYLYITTIFLVNYVLYRRMFNWWKIKHLLLHSNSIVM